MSPSDLHQATEAIGDAKSTWMQRMLGAEVFPGGARALSLPVSPEARANACDFVKRLSPETQRILNESRQR